MCIWDHPHAFANEIAGRDALDAYRQQKRQSEYCLLLGWCNFKCFGNHFGWKVDPEWDMMKAESAAGPKTMGLHIVVFFPHSSVNHWSMIHLQWIRTFLITLWLHLTQSWWDKMEFWHHAWHFWDDGTSNEINLFHYSLGMVLSNCPGWMV